MFGSLRISDTENLDFTVNEALRPFQGVKDLRIESQGKRGYLNAYQKIFSLKANKECLSQAESLDLQSCNFLVDDLDLKYLTKLQRFRCSGRQLQHDYGVDELLDSVLRLPDHQLNCIELIE